MFTTSSLALWPRSHTAGHAHSLGPRPTLVVYRWRRGRDPRGALHTAAQPLLNAAGAARGEYQPHSVPEPRHWQPDSQVG
jgi:hypothetical protein